MLDHSSLALRSLSGPTCACANERAALPTHLRAPALLPCPWHAAARQTAPLCMAPSGAGPVRCPSTGPACQQQQQQQQRRHCLGDAHTQEGSEASRGASPAAAAAAAAAAAQQQPQQPPAGRYTHGSSSSQQAGMHTADQDTALILSDCKTREGCQGLPAKEGEGGGAALVGSNS